MHLKPGTLLQGGKYRIDKVLGQGGFGITYLAVQSGLDRKVAVKEFFMKEHCNRDGGASHVSVPSEGSKGLVETFRQKFIKEAKTIAAMENHHIIRVIEVFEENGTAYYVMEYLSGGSLTERIPSGGLPESEAVGYIRQVAEALSYIHHQKILHLDVKPSNILFRKEDEAVLIDFGISKHYDDEGGSQTSSTPVGVSEGYAPTEQYESAGVSSFYASTDIYSLGATLYCLLSGHRPPKASIVLNDGLPALPSSVSSSVRNAVHQAMSPRRKDRPQSVGAFLELLNAPVEQEGSGDETLPPEYEEEGPAGSSDASGSSRKSGNKRLMTAIAAVLVGFLALFILFRGGLIDFPSGKGGGVADSLVVVSADTVAVDEPVSSEMSIDSTASALAELERLAKEQKAREEAERKQKEEEERKRNEASYSNGVLRVKGVEYPMVYVSGGSFDMGATSEQGSDAYSDEKPVHRVTLSSYSIGKYEVTQELWEAVMGSNPSDFKGARRPVENVSWNDCQDFIRKLNDLTGASFRLPTEAEWEFAARGGNSSRGYKYSGSNSIGDVAWYYDNSGRESHAVGGKSANELGLYDMSGNVWEWCSDCYGAYSSSSQTNLKGSGSGSRRVNRGGGWGYDASGCSVSNRSDNTPGYRHNYIGLRLCH